MLGHSVQGQGKGEVRPPGRWSEASLLCQQDSACCDPSLNLGWWGSWGPSQWTHAPPSQENATSWVSGASSDLRPKLKTSHQLSKLLY